MFTLRRASFIVLIATCLAAPVQAAVLEAGPGQAYPSLKAALIAAKAHDEIRLHAGHYAEGPLNISKALSVTGIGRPVLDGQGQGEILRVTASGVSIRGLVLQNTGGTSMQDRAGIRVENSSDCLISDNQLNDTHFGIYLSNARNCRIERNRIHGEAKRESSAGNAIHSWKSNALKIRSNQVSGHRDGIYLEFTRGSRLERNHSSGNLRYGLHFMFSDRNGYFDNSFEQNGAGVAVMYTREIEMVGNTFSHNWGPSAYGLLLKDISGALIRDNRFDTNTVGLHLEGSSRLQVRGNTFSHNGFAARVLQNSFDNRFEANRFVANSFDIASNASDTSQSVNAFVGNYWDKYSGYDLDRDGTGDVPHHPVSLFSRLVEHVPPAVMLMRSFFVTSLDLAERVSPALTPKTMVDTTPKMRASL